MTHSSANPAPPPIPHDELEEMEQTALACETVCPNCGDSRYISVLTHTWSGTTESGWSSEGNDHDFDGYSPARCGREWPAVRTDGNLETHTGAGYCGWNGDAGQIYTAFEEWRLGPYAGRQRAKKRLESAGPLVGAVEEAKR